MRKRAEIISLYGNQLIAIPFPDPASPDQHILHLVFVKVVRVCVCVYVYHLLAQQWHWQPLLGSLIGCWHNFSFAPLAQSKPSQLTLNSDHIRSDSPITAYLCHIYPCHHPTSISASVHISLGNIVVVLPLIYAQLVMSVGFPVYTPSTNDLVLVFSALPCLSTIPVDQCLNLQSDKEVSKEREC